MDFVGTKQILYWAYELEVAKNMQLTENRHDDLKGWGGIMYTLKNFWSWAQLSLFFSNLVP